MSEPFERFADDLGLRLAAEPLCVAPRDVLAPPSSLELHFLVSLSRPGRPGSDPVRLIFRTPVSERVKPSMRDVLWWLAGDAWVLQRGEGKLEQWAATYGYSAADEATASLFEVSARQTAALTALLGESDMQRLLAVYEAEISAPDAT